MNLIEEGCKLLIGKHDFYHFCKLKPSYIKNGTVREIFQANIEFIKKNDNIEIY